LDNDKLVNRAETFSKIADNYWQERRFTIDLMNRLLVEKEDAFRRLLVQRVFHFTGDRGNASLLSVDDREK
jgi:hypothetical protein